jgi:hypothetical protein
VRIAAASVDLLPELEVFRLEASEQVGTTDHPYPGRVRYESSGETFSAFLGLHHRLLLGAREYVPPDWASSLMTRIVVENLLVIRHYSGQQAFISPDEQQPGTLLVTRSNDQLPGPEGRLLYLRALPA